MPVIGTRAGSHVAPQQHKQPSRKGRKAWRKNVDVSEVERGLEERNEEIIKGGVVSEKQSEELFQVADEGDLAVAKTLAKKYTKGLKADEIIAARSVVPAVSGRKRAGDEPKSKTTDGVLPAKRQRTADYVSHKELLRLKSVANGHHTATVAVTEATYDPWAEEPTAVVLAAAKKTTATALKKKTTTAPAPDAFSFLPPAVVPKAPRSLRQAPVSLAANGKPIPAVATPAGALSYNPAFNEYAARLEVEGAKAVAAERRRLAEAEAERVRMEAVARSAAEADAAEARAELSEWDEDESAWEGFESEVGEAGADGGGGVSAALLAKRPKRKTPAQRNRVNRRKAAEALERHQAKERRLKEQAQRLEQLVGEAAAVAKRDAADKNSGSSSDDGDGDDDEATGDDSVLRRRQLGKFRLPEKDLELVLPDELQDSLRLLRPEGNLLRDRYRSVLVRGKVEARRKRPYRKQAKVKITEKWAHKDFQLF